MSISGVMRNLERVTKAIDADASRAWRAVGNKVQASARERMAKPSDKTAENTFSGANQRRGGVVKSIRFEADGVGAVVGTDSKVGVYQEWGTEKTAPHTILPKNAMRLKFPVKPGTGMVPAKNGKFDWVFARKVRHPGVPAKEWLSKAAEDNEDYIRQTVGKDAALRIESSFEPDNT